MLLVMRREKICACESVHLLVMLIQTAGYFCRTRNLQTLQSHFPRQMVKMTLPPATMPMATEFV